MDMARDILKVEAYSGKEWTLCDAWSRQGIASMVSFCIALTNIGLIHTMLGRQGGRKEGNANARKYTMYLL